MCITLKTTNFHVSCVYMNDKSDKKKNNKYYEDTHLQATQHPSNIYLINEMITLSRLLD